MTESPLDGGRLDANRLAAVLRRVQELEARDVAQEIAASGVLVVMVAPDTKDPLLAREHIDTCDGCHTAGVHGMRDHGATTDHRLLDRYFDVHPDVVRWG